MKKHFLIDDTYNNSRFDRWFRQNICNVPQSLIEKNLRKGNIRINNSKKKSSYKLKKNDKITLFNINFLPNKNKKKQNSYLPSKSDLKSSSDIFVENNENFVVINKPAGISVQSGTKSRKNIIDILRNLKEFDGFKPYPVHRIDKETTGILIVAKNRSYAQLFTSLFRIRKIHKTYLGLVVGQFEKKKGTFKDLLFYYEGKKKTEAKAITHFTVLDSNRNYSLLKLNPETGRKHQLRKQLLMHGHPILGDTKYRITNNRNKSKEFLMLHAYKINFSIDGVKYNFSAKLPENFKDTLKQKYLKSF
ncbi:RNA pseudouridine synthase [Pelagibacteraceae bacterium]|nr:RNA pseudouridine synthase [Pelagibacteraceae bacterium]